MLCLIDKRFFLHEMQPICDHHQYNKHLVGVIVMKCSIRFLIFAAILSVSVMSADAATAQTPSSPTFQRKMPKSVKITTDEKCNVEVEYRAYGEYGPYRTAQNSGVKRIVAVFDVSYLNLPENELPESLNKDQIKAEMLNKLKERYLPFITPTRNGCHKPEVIIQSLPIPDDVMNKIRREDTVTVIFRTRTYLGTEKPVITMYMKYFRPGMSVDEAWKYDFYWSQVMSFSLSEDQSEIARKVSTFIARGMMGRLWATAD